MENEIIEIKQAKRQAAPLLIGIAGPSGAGKTLSGLRLASGLIPEQGRICMISTEPKRGTMYADDPILQKELPQGYDIIEMQPPFTDTRLQEHLKYLNNKGYDLVLIDSETHFFEGQGGMEEQASRERTKWLKPKLHLKKRIYYMNGSNMHIISCIRAREKVKVDKKTGDYSDLGIQPICEKNFMFEMTVSMLLDVDTNTPKMLKCPSPLKPIFEGVGSVITKEVGERLREWNESGAAIDKELNALTLDIREAAMFGSTRYDEHLKELTEEQKAYLKDKAPRGFWAECRGLVEEADRIEKESKLAQSEGENFFDK